MIKFKYSEAEVNEICSAKVEQVKEEIIDNIYDLGDNLEIDDVVKCVKDVRYVKL